MDNPDGLALNWLLLVICAVIVICVLFFLFFWNRLIAWFVAALVRLKYWKSDNAWIEFESIQVSLLAGRIFLKDLRYHSRNQSVRVLKCHITWRYWIWRTRDDMSDAKNLGGEDVNGHGKRLELPCRIYVYMEGVEWFLYNRTPAYDAIVERMFANDTPNSTNPPSRTTSANGGESRKRDSEPEPVKSEHGDAGKLQAPLSRPPSPTQNIFTRSNGALVWLRRQLPTIAFNEILPIEIRAIAGAILLGNDSTPSLVIASFKSARATYGVSPSRSPLDLHKQVFSGAFEVVKIFTRTNPDYSGPMLQNGQSIYSDAERDPEIASLYVSLASHLRFAQFRLLAKLFRRGKHSEAPVLSQSTAPISVWKGLDRFRTEEERIKGEMRHEAEYAKVPMLLDAPKLELVYYADAAGRVPRTPRPSTGAPIAGLETVDIGNGDLAPEWGVDLVIHDGAIKYGPWADRQRDFIQKVFTPSSYQDARETPQLRPGDTRLAAALKFFVQLEGSTTLRIPVRETSKDWKYDGVSGSQDVDPDERPYGWLDITAGSNSSINYVLPAIAGRNGYDTLLELHLVDVSILSSVNGAKFWSADSCRVLCQIPSPLAWKAERHWNFDVTFQKPHVYLLREHTHIITDMVKDWSSGSPSEYAVFIPTIYTLSFQLRDYALNLYCNDHNIVSEPLSEDDNVFLTITGSTFDSEVVIPSNRFRPESNAVSFRIDLPVPSIAMTFPLWNTHAAFATSRTKRVGLIDRLSIEGSYLYYSKLHPDFVEKLSISITAKGVVFRCFGWALRHFLILRDNYFGLFTQFTTVEEYQKRNGKTLGDPVEAKYRPGKVNASDVNVVVNVQDSIIVLPQEIHDCTAAIIIAVPEIEVGLGVHEFSMDLNLLVHPSRLTLTDNSEQIFLGRLEEPKYAESLELESMHISCSRLFGPQPRTSTYFCLWEIAIGPIKGCLPFAFASALVATKQALQYCCIDYPNAPDPSREPASNPDVTFLKVTLDPMDLVFRGGRSALHLQLPQRMLLDYSSLAQANYSKTLSLVGLLSARALVQTDRYPDIWYESANVACDLRCDVYFAPENWQDTADAQMHFVTEQDSFTSRALFVYAPERERFSTKGWQHRGLYCLPYPRGRSRPDDNRASSEDSYDDVSSDMDMDRSHRSSSTKDAEMLDKERDAMRLRRRMSAATPSGAYFDARDDSDEELSSSDDSGNSDTDHSPAGESDRSDSELGDGRGPLESILKRFKLTTPAGLSIPTFVPIEHASALPPHTSRHERWRATSPHAASLSRESRSGNSPGNVTVLVDIRQGLEIFLTPYVEQFLQDLLDFTDKMVHNPERELDILMVARLDSSAQSPSTQTAVDIRVQSISMRLVQSVKVPRISDSHRGKLQTVHGLSRETVGVLTFFDVGIGESSVLLDFTSSYPSEMRSYIMTCKGTVTAPRSSLWQTKDGDRRLRGPATMHETLSASTGFTQVFEMASEGIQVVLGSDDSSIALEVALATCELRVMGTSAESIPAVLTATEQLFQRLRTSQEAVRMRAVARFRYLLWVILHSSDDTDPAFLDRTSFFIQDGRPANCRSDSAWRIIAHARHCLRRMQVIQFDHLARVLGTDAVVSDSAMESKMYSEVIAVLKRWRTWEVDVASPSAQRLLGSLFPTSHPHQGAIEPQSPLHLLMLSNVIRLRVNSASVSFLDNGLTETVLSSGPLDLLIQSCLRRYGDLGSEEQGLMRPDDDSQRHDRILHIFGSVSAERIDISLAPDLIPLVQRFLRIHRVYQKMKPDIGAVRPVVQVQVQRTVPQWLLPHGERVLCDIKASSQLVSVQAAAQKITFDVVLEGFTLATTLSVEYKQKEGLASALSSGLTLNSILLRARSPHGISRSDSDYEALAWINVLRTSVAIGLRKGIEPTSTSIRVVLGSDTFRFSVPHSALRLHKFIEEWRAEYLPTYDTMLQDLLAELEQDQPDVSPSVPIWPSISGLDIQAGITTIGIDLRVLPSTWLSWEFHGGLVILGKTPVAPSRPSKGIHYGLKLRSQTIRLVQATASFNEGLPTSSPLMMLELPSFHMTGDFSQSTIRSSAIVDFFDISISAQMMDDVLLIPAKFGKDLNDILDVVLDSRQAGRQTNKPSQSSSGIGTNKLGYHVRVMLRGFEIGIKGPSSTQLLEASRIEGDITRDLSPGILWKFSILNVTLSLAHLKTDESRGSNDVDRFRSAYMMLDLEASNRAIGGPTSESKSDVERLSVAVHKVHAVMQAAAIGELGDLIDHYRSEMLTRQDQRAAEIQSIKAQTQRVLQTFEVDDRKLEEESASWFSTRIISVAVSQIGIAFPLTLDEIAVPKSETAVEQSLPMSPAFLFAVNSIAFDLQRTVIASAKVQQMTIQFVSRFNQNDSDQFSSSQHKTRNLLRFPEMKVDARSSTSTRSHRIRLRASVTGFDLDLDPMIAVYVFSLVDVYQQGQERFRHLALLARSGTNVPSAPNSEVDQSPSASRRGSLDSSSPTLGLKASFEFRSARVRLYPPDPPDQSAKATNNRRGYGKPATRTELGIEGVPHARVAEPDTFNLPTVSAWCEYAGPVEVKPAALLLSVVVHPSQNTLNPTLLPFLLELSRKVEQRLQRMPPQSSSVPIHIVSPPLIQPDATGIDSVPSFAMDTMAISLSLRIDQSTLEMACQPHVNVAAVLMWESGGFLITVSPGAKEVTVFATAAGVDGRLRHGYLSESCVRASARNLAISAALKRTQDSKGTLANVISVVVDTQVAGSVRFSRLQDLLCFKAVWLDSIPVVETSRKPYVDVEGQTASISPTFSKPSAPITPVPSRPLITNILFRMRDVHFEADLGQSISRVSLQVDSIVLRSHLTGDSSEVSLSVTKVEIVADRTLSGYTHLRDVVFETVLHHRHSRDKDNKLRMLDLRIGLGEMEVSLFSDYKKLLQFHSDPVQAWVYDDWSSVVDQAQPTGDNKTVGLGFSVKAGNMEAICTVLTLPRLIATLNRLQALISAQRDGAARESEAFRSIHSARPENPLSEVATAMIQSARSKFRDEADSASIIIIQTVELDAAGIRLGVFPRSTSDQDLVRFEANNVLAKLVRDAAEDGRLHRYLDLSLSSFSIHRLQPRPLTVDEIKDITASRWFDILKTGQEVTLFNGPPTQVMMESWEDAIKMRIDYEYDMTYNAPKSNGQTEGSEAFSEGSVFLALNYGLLKWLGSLAQSFQEEMDKVTSKDSSADIIDLPITPASPRWRETHTPASPVLLVAPSHAPSRPTTPPPGPSTGLSSPSQSPASPQPQAQQPQRMTYHKITPGVIELPQLVQLGDITPRSNQLTLVGLRLDLIPKWVHEAATLPLEEIMKVLLQLYSRQLRQMKRDS